MILLENQCSWKRKVMTCQIILFHLSFFCPYPGKWCVAHKFWLMMKVNSVLIVKQTLLSLTHCMLVLLIDSNRCQQWFSTLKIFKYWVISRYLIDSWNTRKNWVYCHLSQFLHYQGFDWSLSVRKIESDRLILLFLKNIFSSDAFSITD
jgi:hypothetical protein